MKPTLILIPVLLLFAALIGASPAFAGHDEEEGDPVFRAMDANGDHRLTRAEHAAGARDVFAAMDANHDGLVTAAEMDAHRAQRTNAAIRFSAESQSESATHSLDSGAARADGAVSSHEVANANGAIAAEPSSVEKIRQFDQDRDGRLTATEYAAGSAALFGQLDADHDGFLTEKECSSRTGPGRNL